MITAYLPPGANCYRRVKGIRVVMQEKGGLALCAYPLRVVRVSETAAHLLQACTDDSTCAELSKKLHLPPTRVETLCEQLRHKGLLEAGPPLPPTQWPSVSIIIPTYNRAQQLERCLNSLCALDYPAASLEILIVDDASTDETHAMLQRFINEETHARDIHVLHHQTQQGVALSRNTGAEAARYELLAYIDSDCVASRGWLRELVPIFQDESVAAVGGMIRAYEHESVLGRYEDVRSSLFMGLRPQEVSPSGPLQYLPTANFLVRRAHWQQLGGFAPLTFGEDVDFCRRLLALNSSNTPNTPNVQIRYLPLGVVYHDYRTRLPSFLRIRASYASAEAALLQRHPEERRILILPPEQASFAGLVVGGLWKCMHAIVRSHPHPSPRIPARGTRTMDEAALVHGTDTPCGYPGGWRWGIGALLFLLALILTLWGTHQRLRKVRQRHIPRNVLGPFTIWRATVRGHLAYTYHLTRHVTRYYTLPLLCIGIILPPLLILTLILLCIVIGVDYVRLRPNMGLGAYAWCAVLDDCAYEVGVVQGCIKQRTWKPLWPLIKRSTH